MATVSISPVWNGQQFFTNEGKPLAGGKIFTYEANSFTSKAITCSTSDGDVENPNPIVLDSSGRLATDIWLLDGQFYNLVLMDAAAAIVLESIDEVTGVKAATASAGQGISVWNSVPGANYVSATQLIFPGNVTTEFAPGNRVRIENGDGTFQYGTVTASSFSSPNTMVTVAIDGGASLSSLLVDVSWSSLSTSAKAVDAGAVSYTPGLSYASPGTVGNKLNNLDSAVASVNASLTYLTTVQLTSGSPPDFTLTSPQPTYTTGQVYTIRFHAGSNTPTLNVNGQGPKAIKQYTTNVGNKAAASVVSGQVTVVLYDGADFIITNPLPAAVAATEAIPHGQQIFGANGSFTPPTNVTSVKVTAIGGGGGGGNSNLNANMDAYNPGGTGGSGGVAVKTIPVTPGQPYAVSIGGGGAFAAPGGNSIFGSNLVVGGGGGPGGDAVQFGWPGGTGATGSVSAGAYGAGANPIIDGIRRGAGGAGASNPYNYSTGDGGLPGGIIVEW
jgi:hypothetical protein